MRRYLLGGTSPEERADFEKRYLSDSEIFEELVEAENDLMDAYARRQLSETESQEFERRYLSSESGKARMHYAAALAQLSQEPRAVELQRLPLWKRWTSAMRQQHRGLRLGLAGLAAALLIIGSLTFVNRRSVETAHQLGKPPASTSPTGDHPQELANSNAPEWEGFAVQLSPGVARDIGSKQQVVTVPAQSASITFRLLLEEDSHPAYAAVLETAEGHRVQRSDRLKSRMLDGNKIVELSVPPTLLPTGDYVIRLDGTAGGRVEAKDAETYTFRVIHE